MCVDRAAVVARGATSGTTPRSARRIYTPRRPGRALKRLFRRDRGCLISDRRGRRRLGPERPRRGDRARAGGRRVHGARGRGDDRRRLPHRGADAARLRARRLLGGPPAGARLAVLGRLPLPSTASSWSIPRRRSRIRSTTARRCCSSARSSETADGLGPRRARPTGGSSSRSCATARRADAGDPRPAAAAAPSRSRWRASAASALRSATGLARSRFEGERARALFAGCAAHSILPLEQPPTAAFGLVLMMARTRVGWPVARGGSQAIADALAAHLRSLGGEIETGSRVRVARRARRRAARRCSTSRRASSSRSPATACRPATAAALARYRYGPGVFKLDWALDGADPVDGAGVPRARAPCTSAARSRRSPRPSSGRHAASIPSGRSCSSPSRASSTRAARPAGKHTAWAYCHVPNGSTRDMTDAIEGQVERFAPGFRDRIARARAMDAAEIEAHNPNYVGGDINGGAARTCASSSPARCARRSRTRRPSRRLYLCSSSTPPGGGVHGMCGYFAARAALRRLHSE